MLWCKWRLFVILFMILHEFPNVLLKYSKNSHWNNDCWNHLPFLMMHHTCNIWLGGHTTVFPFEMKIHEWKVWQGGHITSFPFLRYGSGQMSRHMLFSGYKRQEHTSKMQETCKKHARLSSPWLHSSGTLLPFSYGIENGVQYAKLMNIHTASQTSEKQISIMLAKI